MAAVEVADQSEQTRKAATRKALAQVLVKVTGDRQVDQLAVAEDILARSERYLEQFGYFKEIVEAEPEQEAVQDEVPEYLAAPETEEEPKEPEERLMLRVRFDERAVNQALRSAGLPIWSAERPLTVVWVAVDDGESRRILFANEAPRSVGPEGLDEKQLSIDIDALLETAEDRGMPLRLPEDAGRVSSTDIWEGFNDTLVAASGRYRADYVLIGRIYSDPVGWDSDWTLMRGEEWQGSWDLQAEATETLMATAIHDTADALASRFAVSSQPGVASLVTVHVLGVNSVADYAKVQDYLESLTLVTSVTPETIAEDRASFQVEIQGEPELLKRSVGFGNRLEVADTQAPAGPKDSVLVFRLLESSPDR